MRRLLTLGALVVTGTLSAALGAAQQPPAGAGRQGGTPPPPPSAAGLTVDKVRDNLYVLKGGGGNTAVFIRDNGVLLVDTKNPGWGQPIIERVRELTDKPVTTIINTHTHGDHTSGNVAFPATVDIVTHESTAKYMREANPVTGLQTGPQRNLFEENKGLGYPKRTFTDRMTVGTGKDRVELYHLGRAHTGGDAFVVFPALRVMHTGDAFPNKGIPIMDANNGGSGVDYAATVDKAAALRGIDTVITGHNGTTVTMAEVKEYADFNRAFVEDVRAAKKAGRTVDEVAKTWKVPAAFAGFYQQPAEGRLRSNVQVVWDELK
jgi:glyoxylase-like metal-dependent hydrolase (beta-lactamase superfamily II)